MGTTFKLAWRNVWRQRRRALLLVLVVAYAVAATIFIWGFNRGQTQSLLSNQARYLRAPAIVAAPGYFTDPDPENALPNLDFVPRAEGVRGVAGRLEPLVSSAPSKITEGRMLNGPNEVVMGAGLARELDVRLGERVAVEASSLAGPQALGFILVGTVKSDVPAVDDGLVMISFTSSCPQLTGQLQVPQDDATWIFQAGAGLPESGVLGVLGASVNIVNGDVSSVLSLNAGFSEAAVTVGVGLELTGAF